MISTKSGTTNQIIQMRSPITPAALNDAKTTARRAKLFKQALVRPLQHPRFVALDPHTQAP